MEISVIIPVYNAENFLLKCIESVLGQTFADFELILVNDGSKDNSLQICKEYSLKDDRIVVIDKKNGGAASARNKGLDVAKGNYVVFIDSDDYVDNQYLEKLYQAVKQNDADMAVCSLVVFKGQEQNKYVNEDKVYSQKDYVLDCFNGNIKDITAFGPCMKIISLKIIKDDDIRFPEGYKLSEDRIFNLLIMDKLKKVVTISYVGYYYVDNVNSLTHNRRDDYIVQNIIQAETCFWNKAERLFESLGLISEYKNFIFNKRLRAFLAFDSFIVNSRKAVKIKKKVLYNEAFLVINDKMIEEYPRKGIFKILFWGLKRKSQFVVRAWLWVMRLKQKLK